MEDDDEGEGSQPDVLPQTLVEKAITSVADRVNYGVDWVEKPPSNLCVWRWELKENYKSWLPKSGVEKFSMRIAERRQVRGNIFCR